MMEQNVIAKAIKSMTDYEGLMKVIEIRHSTRTFTQEQLSQEHIDIIKEYLANQELLKGPLGKGFHIELIQKGPLKEKDKIGTYGYVKNSQAFLVGMSENNKYNLFEIAYVFQGLVLYLTEIGIGTCWLGGIFNQDDVRASTFVPDDEIVPAISPIGYPSDHVHVMGKMASFVLKPYNRHPVEEIAFYVDFSTPFTDQNSYLYEAIRLGTLAPNAQNKQSWRILVSKDQKTVHLYVKFKLKKQVHDNFRGYACPPEYLDIGIFYRHFDTYMKAKGIEGTLSIFDPGYELPDEQMEYIITWNRS